ncbi:hypothetical protein RB25_02760 [Herbaspirillum rubrisubalbicans]|nr:hypothetical protein RB25_02760 [Herbaspirillum rubrisubalbicans]
MLEQYDNHERFIGIEAVALDRLGRSAEAVASLQKLIDAGVDEPFAVTTYLNIVIRSGFTDQAIALLETILGREINPYKKLQSLQLLFNLVYFTTPQNARCMDILFQIGELVDQSKEDEEGSFLVRYIVASQVTEKEISPEKIAAVRIRLEKFLEAFPSSNILKRGNIPENGTAADILAAIEKIVGQNTNQKEFYKRIGNEVRTGTTPVPYAWRPRNVLQNIRDLPHLWERGKRSNTLERQYHLAMTNREYVPVAASAADGHVPLLDLTSLLVLQDLNLLDHLFNFFPKIAIGQATLSELNELIRPMSGSVYANRCLALQTYLKLKFSVIEQPYVEKPSDDSFSARNWESEEVKELASSGRYMLYADDFLFRLYCQIPSGHPPAICTMDFLSILEEKGVLSEKEIAEKISTLSGWHVDLLIKNRHVVAVFPDEFISKKNTKDAINVLHRHPTFLNIYNAIWDIGHPYQQILGNFGVLAHLMIENPAYEAHHIAAYLMMWNAKSILRTDVKQTPELALITSILQIAFVEPPLNKDNSKKLIDAYRYGVQAIFGDKMDEAIEAESLQGLGWSAANEDKRNSFENEKNLGARLKNGLTENTADSDIFNKGYADGLIDAELAALQK